MALFDYRGQDNAELIGEAYALAAYTSTLTGTSVPEGWEVLSPSDLGLSPTRLDAYGYFEDDGGAWGGQAKVLVKKDANGNVEQVCISYAATNTLTDVYSYAQLYTNTYDNAFDYLTDAVEEYCEDNNVSGDDVIVTGYSLGGGAVNNMASSNSFGFYSDANYVGFASPIFTTGDNVYNFGFENDAVFRLDFGNSTSTDNIVLFNDSYASSWFAWAGFTIANVEAWDAHIDGFNNQPEILSSIVDSHFYEEMTRDDLIIIQQLSNSERDDTWVEPVDRRSGDHDGDDAFILGNNGEDLLRGDGGDDRIDGHGGNDQLDGRAGNDELFGGAGDDTLTGGSGSDTFIFTAGFGDDTITDFDTSSDLIEIDSSIFSDFNDLMANAEEETSGGGGWWWGGGSSSTEVVINAGNDSITLEGVELNDLSANDFVFV